MYTYIAIYGEWCIIYIECLVAIVFMPQGTHAYRFIANI